MDQQSISFSEHCGLTSSTVYQNPHNLGKGTKQEAQTEPTLKTCTSQGLYLMPLLNDTTVGQVVYE